MFRKILTAVALLTLVTSALTPITTTRAAARSASLPSTASMHPLDCQTSAEKKRPVVIIGGWSSTPENILDSMLVNSLAKRLFVVSQNPAGSFVVSTPGESNGGLTSVLLTRHLDAYGDINANATFEAAQIVKFMDLLNAESCCAGTDFDLIGFSMGGLVARSIVLKFPTPLGKYRVANLITMGTPNHGVNPIVTGVGTLWYGPQGNAAALRQMEPFSSFLNDLNARQIPSAIKVTTIAGEALVDTVPQPLHPEGDNAVVACAHLVPQHPNGDQLPATRVPCAHPTCRRRVGNVCVEWGREHPDGDLVGGGVVPCGHLVRQHPDGDAVKTPCTHRPASTRVGVGSDGLVRVLSVNLRSAEAANIVAQPVLSGLWHTEGTENLARYGFPVPRPFINARNSPPEQGLGVPPPIMGTAFISPHFFSDPRVRDIVRSVVNSR